MENEKKFPGTSFRIPPDLLREFKIACAQRDTTQTAVVTEFIRRWLEIPTEKPEPAYRETPTPMVVSRSEDRWHQMLAEIFASGDAEAIQAVQQNIQVFHRIVRAAASGVSDLRPRRKKT